MQAELGGHAQIVFPWVKRSYQWIEKAKRIVDPEAVNAARLPYCEHCGFVAREPGQIHAHHLVSRGAGGHDRPDNLISLCWLCHLKVHNGRIPRARIRALVEAREGRRGA